MTSRAERLVKTAESYAGYLEKASNRRLEDFTANAGSGNWTLFGQWYGLNGFPWCAMFVSFCADKAGIPVSVIPKHASCAVGISWFKHKGRWHDRDGYTPQAGDIVYFTHDGTTPAHVGIVRDANASGVYTVEGNTSGGSALVSNGGGVAKKSYPPGCAKILGYAHPDYKEETEMNIEDVRRELTSVAGTGGGHSDWADEAVGMFADAGVISGDGQGNYGWGQCLTREGAAKVLYNLLDRLGLLDRLR